MRVAIALSLAAGLSAGCSLSSGGDAQPRPSSGAALGAVVPSLGAGSVPIDPAAVAALLDSRAKAILRGDAVAFRATTDGADGQVASEAATEWKRITSLPLTAWSYDLITATPTTPAADGTPRGSASVRLHYRLGASDVADSIAIESMGLALRANGWVIDSEKSAAAPLLWENGDITVRTVNGVVAIGVGNVPASELVDVGQREDAALSAVARFIQRPVPVGAVVVVPAQRADLALLLGRSISSLQRIAAVTMTGTGDGQPGADRVWINRSAFEGLSGVGRDIVLRHETTHLALGAASSDATPLWLEEGMAELVGYRGSGVPLDVAAADVLAAASAGRLPTALPDTAAFNGDSPELGSAYHQAWTACLWLATQLGDAGLVGLYQATAAGHATDPEVNADAALARAGLTRPQLVAGWRADLVNWAAGGTVGEGD